MVHVVNRGNLFFRLSWCRAICRQKCTWETLWLAFPATAASHDAPVRGRWIHRECLNGKAAAVFETPHVTLMRGLDALRQLAEALQTIQE
jgi:hypothetical protein